MFFRFLKEIDMYLEYKIYGFVTHSSKIILYKLQLDIRFLIMTD
jgi:hypothetical protein